jgi:hypothetical protein
VRKDRKRQDLLRKEDFKIPIRRVWQFMSSAMKGLLVLIRKKSMSTNFRGEGA